jgi:hypothetical protein
LAFVVPLAMTLVAQLIGWAPVTVVLTILAWGVAIAAFVWLMLRPRRSPIVPDATPEASAHKPPPASRPGS